MQRNMQTDRSDSQAPVNIVTEAGVLRENEQDNQNHVDAVAAELALRVERFEERYQQTCTTMAKSLQTTS